MIIYIYDYIYMIIYMYKYICICIQNCPQLKKFSFKYGPCHALSSRPPGPRYITGMDWIEIDIG